MPKYSYFMESAGAIHVGMQENIQGDSEISLEKKCGVSLTQNNSA
jgi:hypothetical protein